MTDPAPEEPGFYRDETGALKRQAALFRVYGYNAAGEVVGELTADTADIRWAVHVANRKAAWYQWTMALDIPEAAGSKIPRRNKSVTGDTRNGLVIDGEPKSITGKGTHGAAYEFRGKFQGVEVYLGEVRTDDAGRLLFLGGHREVRRLRPGARSSTRATRTGSSTPTAGTTTCPTARSPPR